jgi:hypothetical protein
VANLQVRVWAENASVGVCQWAAETMGIWQDKGDLTTQQIDNQVREGVWAIVWSMSIMNKQGTGTGQWDLLIHCFFTRISDLEYKRQLWKWFMVDETNLNGQKLEVALDEFAEVVVWRRINKQAATLTKKRNLVHIGMYSIAPMLVLLFLMSCTSRE